MKHRNLNIFFVIILYLSLNLLTACNKYAFQGCNINKKTQGILLTLYALENKHNIDPFQNKNYRGPVIIQKMITNNNYTPSEKPLETEKGKTEYYDNKGIIETQSYRYLSAINNFKEAIQTNPDYSYAYNNIAVTYMLKDNIDEATTYLMKALNLCNKDPALYNNLGVLNYLKKDYIKAICYLKKAIIIDPGNVYYYNNLALAYQNNGNPQSALDNYYIALTLNPDLKLIKNNYLSFKSTLQKSKSSFKDYCEAIFTPSIIKKLKHKHFETYNYSVTSKEGLSYKQVWRKFKKKPLSEAWQYNDSGITYTMEETYDKAIQTFLQGIKVAPDYASSYNNIAVVYILKNEPYSFEENFEKSLSLDPEIPEFYLNLGAISITNKNYDKALTNLHQALKCDNMDPGAYNNLGILFESQGNYNIAYVMYSRALFIVSRDKHIFKRLKNAQTKIDNPEACDSDAFCQ